MLFIGFIHFTYNCETLFIFVQYNTYNSVINGKH